MDKTISSPYFKSLLQYEKTVKDLTLWLTQELRKLDNMDDTEWDYYLEGKRDSFQEVLDVVIKGK